MLTLRFSDDVLEKVRSEALFYQCACPAQVCVSIAALRELYAYQQNCLTDTNKSVSEQQVHQEIAASTARAHTQMEECLDRVLTMEGWDRETYQMPDGLRTKLTEHILSS